MVEEIVYTVNELAKMLKANPDTVRRWCRDGRIECIQLLKDYRISKKVVDKLLAGKIKVK